MSLEDLFLQFLQTVEITSGFNAGLTIAFFFLILIAEANLHIPLLIESIWLAIGYQASINVVAFLNMLLLFALAQLSRQIGMLVLFYLVRFVNTPLSKLYMKLLQNNKWYKKYAANEYLHNVEFFSSFSVFLGMLTPLNGPLKIILIIKGKLRVLLIGTLFSGMVFDSIYIVMGAIFHTTTLSLGYLPVFLLMGFLVFMLLRETILKSRGSAKGVQ